MEDFELVMLIYYCKIFIGSILILYSAIKLKNNNKKLTLKSTFAFFLGFVLLVIPMDLIMSFDIETLTIFLSIPQIWIGLLALVIGIILKIMIKTRNNYYVAEAYYDMNFLKRDIDIKFNPSIVGFLYEHKLELKDLSADILNLYAKKIVDIKKDENGKNIILLGEKYEKQQEELKNSDKYIIESIKNGRLKIDFEKWNDEVKKEYEKLEFSKKTDGISDKMFFLIIISIVMSLLFIFMVICKWDFFGALGTSLGIAFGITFITYIIYLNVRVRYIKLTEKGKKAIKDCMKLKMFMEEYSLLEDRTVEEICVYESYIPYAVALGINKKYKGTIFEIFDEELSNILDDINIIEFYEERRKV